MRSFLTLLLVVTGIAKADVRPPAKQRPVPTKALSVSPAEYYLAIHDQVVRLDSVDQGYRVFFLRLSAPYYLSKGNKGFSSIERQLKQSMDSRKKINLHARLLNHELQPSE